MKTFNKVFTLLAITMFFLVACGEQMTNPDAVESSASSSDVNTAGQAAVSDDVSQRNVVQVAVASPDHTTLVTAVTAAELVNVLSNNGPFTVFAPVNAAFEALPEGTVENLLKPESKDALSDILEYHVYLGVITENLFQDGMVLNQVNLKNVTLHKTADGMMVNDAKVLGAVTAANGIVYVIDKVLLPPETK